MTGVLRDLSGCWTEGLFSAGTGNQRFPMPEGTTPRSPQAPGPVVESLGERWLSVRVKQNQIVIECRFVTVAMHDIGMHSERTPSKCIETKTRRAIAA